MLFMYTVFWVNCENFGTFIAEHALGALTHQEMVQTDIEIFWR